MKAKIMTENFQNMKNDINLCIYLLKCLCAAGRVFQYFQTAGILACPFGTAAHTFDFKVPGVRLSGGNALGFDRQRKSVSETRIFRLAEKCGVIPGFTGNSIAVFIRTVGNKI